MDKQIESSINKNLDNIEHILNDISKNIDENIVENKNPLLIL